MIKSITTVIAKINASDQSEILSMIDPEDLALIKTSDPHPFFQLYSFAHEGESSPEVVGDDNPEVISWPRRAIESIKNIVLKGVSFFKNHLKKGDTDRKIIGTIVASAQKQIDGILHHVVVTYHPPDMKEEAIKCDTCSQEAVWNFIPESGKRWVAEKIEELKAIAGLNSNNDRPAFSGAMRLAAITAAKINKEVAGEAATPGEGAGEKTMEKELKDFSFAEIIKHLKTECNAKARDLVTIDDLRDDRTFNPIFEEVETLKAQLKAVEDEKLKMSATLEELNKKELAATAIKRAEAIIKKLKIENDVIKNRIMKIAEKEPERDDKAIEDEANGLLEIQKSIVKQNIDKTDLPGDSAAGQGEKDYRDPKNNLLIKP